MHSVWKNISVRYMEDAKVISETEILHMAGTQFSKAMENLSVAVGYI